MYRCSFACHGCNAMPGALSAARGEPLVPFAGLPCVVTPHAARGGGAPSWPRQPLTARLNPNGATKKKKNRHPHKADLITAAFLRSRSAHTTGAHNRTRPGTGLNVLNKLMKSTHETQAGHDTNLYSRETRPSQAGVSSIRLFIRLYGAVPQAHWWSDKGWVSARSV